jgi:hypothetical protein
MYSTKWRKMSDWTHLTERGSDVSQVYLQHPKRKERVKETRRDGWKLEQGR